MDFTEVIEQAHRFAGFQSTYDDLIVDRLHNRYTVAGLICFVLAMSTYQYLGNPIECWVPAQFTDNYETYTNQLCYIQNTYHIPPTQNVPQNEEFRRERTLKYYQWIPFVLLFQAFFFSLPKLIWKAFNHRFGLSLPNLLDATTHCETFENVDERRKVIEYLADAFQRYEEYVNPIEQAKSSRWKRRCRSLIDGRTGSSLACFYIFIKCLYLLNLIFQLIFLQYFLSYHDVHYFQYGIQTLVHLISVMSFPENRLFPRITLCDFRIRELGEKHFYTVECILVINIFIEKLYFLLWIWFVILFIVSLIDILRFIYSIYVQHNRHMFVTNHLDLLVRSPSKHEQRFRRFLNYISIDHIFVLYLLSANTNEVIIAEILDELFERHQLEQSDV